MTIHSEDPKKLPSHSLKDIFRGMLTLGGGKEEGIAFFPSTTDGVLSALAPWLAVILVPSFLSLLSLIQYKKLYLLTFIISLFLCALCNLLIIPVIIHLYAVYWKKERFWKRTVSAYLWCRWMPVFDLMIGIVVISLFGFSSTFSSGFFAVLWVLFVAYMLWINWYTVKTGLQLKNMQSIIVVVTIVVIGLLFSFLLTSLNHDLLQRLLQDLLKFQENGL